MKNIDLNTSCYEKTMDIVDRRVRRTQDLLAKALIDLTLEKGYEAVSIRDLTARADIGYATFFRHYRDKDGLLKDVVNVVLQELVEFMGPEDNQGDPVKQGTLLFRFVQEHSQVIEVLLSSRGSSTLLSDITEASAHEVLKHRRPLAGSSIPPEIAAYYLAAASIALIQWWLKNKLAYPPEKMGQIHADLVVKTVRSLAFED